MKNRPIRERFSFAFDGLCFVWRTERSFRTECGFAAAAAVALVVLRPGWQWAALIVVCAMVVMALELVNSSLEYLIDHVHPDIATAIKHAKDAAAAAVLVASTGAVLVAALMLASVVWG